MQTQTLKSQLRLWTALLVLVPSLLVMTIYTVGQIQVAKQGSLKLINQRVHAQKALIDYWVAERRENVRKLSQLNNFRRLDEEQIRHTLAVMQQDNKNFDSLQYIDKDGFLKIGTFKGKIKHPWVGDRPFFQRALAEKDYCSDMVIGRNSGLPILFFSSPIFDDSGNFQGVVLGAVRTTTLETLLRENWFGDTGEIFLVNREGVFLTDPRYLNRLIDKGLIEDTAVMKLTLPEDALRSIKLGESGTATWSGYTGRKSLIAYLDVPEREWTLIGKIEEGEVLAPIYEQLLMMAGGILIFIVLALPLTTLITNRFKRPIDWLIEQSNLVRTKHYKMVRRDKRTENIPSELVTLCEVFVKMSKQIENTISLLRENEVKLESKVQERTRALSHMNIVLEREIAKHQEVNTALKDSRDALIISDTRYKDLFDYMHNGCSYHKVVFDEIGSPVDLQFVSVNHAYEIQAGLPASELIGKRLTEVFPKIDEESFNWKQLLITVAIDREATSHTQYHQYQERWYSTSAYSPAKGHVAVISEDVTKYITLQNEVARMDRLNLIGNMAAGLAHEIRNPMTVVKGYLQYFKQKIPEGLHNQLDVALNELARIESIITDFLAIGKTRPMEPQEQDLNEIINNIAPLVFTDALKRGMNVQLQLSKDLPRLMLAEKEIKQLMLNLVMNGLNAMDKNGTLTIETKYHNKAVLLYVDDCGCGIPKDLQMKIFDPFFTTRDEGTGLGLSVCASIVVSHNGTIEVCSEMGKGTRFIVTLPVEKLL